MQPRGRSDEDPVAALERELRRNVTRYQEYNASTCAEFVDETPSALEFHRFVASNRPVVLRRQGYRDQVPALDKWTDEYLVDKMEQRLVDISVDPTGNADSIVQGYFVEPATVPMTMEQLFSQLRHEDEARTGGDKEEDEAAQRPVFYLQSQNGNLSSTGEYASLLNDVGSEGPSWAREAFGQSPDVANIWIGGDRSKTSVHKDPYENIYLVVRGAKDFLLWPPSEAYCMHEQKYPHASWSYDPAATAATTTTRDDKDGFKLVPTEPRVSIPWIPIDPLVDSTSRHPRYALARAMHVRLEQGDMLYLPACWYHHVSQSGGYFHQNVEDKKTRGAENEGRRAGTGTKATIAVNWWFDMKFDGHFYSSLELNRRLVKALDRAQSRRRQREMRDGTSDRLEPSRMFLREEEAGHRDEDETSLDSDDLTR